MANIHRALTAAGTWLLSWRDRALALAPATLSALVALTLMAPPSARAAVALGDQPLFSNAGVPGNLALALSVEYPTAVSRAHIDNTYDSNKTYLGYFDPEKCYLYNYDNNELLRHFYPQGSATNRQCTGSNDNKWSGNFMNWVTMQTIDPFRWALTGGYRSTDTPTTTILEKAWASGQGGTGNFPNKSVSGGSVAANSTPLNIGSTLKMRIQGLGVRMRFTGSSGNENSNAATAYNPNMAMSASTTYEVSIRVKVCDNSAAAGPLESNCTQYPNGNYKPTGLIQQYASRIRYSTFGYLNDSNVQRDGGVLRARQKFVGPTYTLPGAVSTNNSATEWDALTGVFTDNPDAADATATNAATGVSVTNSGVINYLNKFGQLNQGNYKTYDNVSELYYAALRYFKNQGNVPEWTSMSGANTSTKTTWVDGFPVITNWDDPLLYACQKNFVLGIGDVNTHADKNVPGNTPSGNEPSKPAAVSSDTSVNAVTATNKVGQLHGLSSSLGSTNPYNGCCTNNSALIAGLAYDANGKDIRPDVVGKPQTVGKQTVQTYWLDVLEYGAYKANNQYYLATKYGGAKLPDTFDPYAQSTDLTESWWYTNGQFIFGQKKPDNYFTAAKADDMVDGLTQAFSSIAANLRAYTTSFSTAAPQVAQTGTASYSAQYDASSWTGELSAATTVFDAITGQPSNTGLWNFSSKLATQASSNGWDNGRRIVTWNTSTNMPVPLRLNNLSATQKAALDTAYRTGDDSADYLNYLRGQTLHEEGSTTPGSSQAYRKRTQLLGDIVGSKPRAVGAPSMPFSSATNPGYSAFKTLWANRQPMVYVGSNAGMLHAVDGSTGATGGTEVFAYVPGALFQGPTNTPQTNGLAARGNPNFSHKYMVDATPAIFDIDFGRTVGGTGTDWRSLLVSGLGKGGKRYFAIDVSNPAAFTSETVTATKVLWEFSDPDLGYTYGEPTAVKTRKYGWVLVFGSGYGNSDGKGYFFIVNPRNGALLDKIPTGAGSTTAEAGMAHVKAFVLDRTDNTADSVYAGDLLGNLWRLDLRAGSTGTIPAPTKLATLADANNNPRPVTSRPSIIVQPITNTRWVTVGTGQLLDIADAGSSQMQAMYAIKDGTGLGFNATAPTGFNFPIISSNLLQLVDLTQPVTLNNSTQIGWYVELGLTSGQGWRMISDPTSYYGSVEFTTMLPNGDACNPQGTSRVYAIELGTGQSALVASDDVTPVAYSDALVDVATEQRSYAVDDGTGTMKRRYVACSSNGGCTVIKTKQPAALGLRRLNWRELPLAN